MLRQLLGVQAMLEGDPTLALPRLIAQWGDRLYSGELASAAEVDAALRGLSLPPGPVSGPPGTVQPPAGPHPETT